MDHPVLPNLKSLVRQPAGELQDHLAIPPAVPCIVIYMMFSEREYSFA